MTAIGPGDFVECVDNTPRAGRAWHHESDVPVVGALYQVERIGPDIWGGEQFALKEIRQSPQAVAEGVWGYGAFRFRPIYRPRADLIERLLQPIDETTPEQVLA